MKDSNEVAEYIPEIDYLSADPAPVYRGYRRQALYTLHRVLESIEPDTIFQPEGVEDLAIFDQDRLTEAIQVKSFTNNLTLSDLVSKDHHESSFFHRAVSLVRQTSVPQITLVSFGGIGPELISALAGEGRARARVFQKLVHNYGFEEDDVSAIFERLTFKTVEEELLQQDILAKLRDAATGADPEASFDLLTQWLYGCAERKYRLSQQDIRDRINRVGRYAAEGAAV